MFGIEKDFQNLMEQVYGPLNKDKMTEIEELKGQIKVLEKKLALLEEIENHKSPVEKAYRDAYGDYPVTDDMSGSDIDYVSWDAFQKGYNAAYEEKVSEEPEEQKWNAVRESVKWCEENPDKDPLDWVKPQTPEQVSDGLKEAFREAVKQGVVSSVEKPRKSRDALDDILNKMVEKHKGQTLYDLIGDWWDDVFVVHNACNNETAIENLVDMIDEWLPTEHKTNSYKWNECIRMIREKLR